MLVNNAGLASVGAVEELDDRQLRDLMDVMFFGPVGLGGGCAEMVPFGVKVLVVEPGAFATSFGGARSQTSPDSGVYDATVGPQRRAVDGMDGSQPGDPAKAAAAILDALAAEPAPLRLALGDDAVDAIGAALDARRSELDAWAALGRPPTFPMSLTAGAPSSSGRTRSRRPRRPTAACGDCRVSASA